MGVYSGFNSYHYFNACACALCVLLLTHQNENRFLAFGSLISNAEAENAMISNRIIVCSSVLEYNCCVSFMFVY